MGSWYSSISSQRTYVYSFLYLSNFEKRLLITVFLLISDIHWYEPTNQYFPVVYINDFWNLNEEYMPLNESTPELTFRLTVAPLSLFKWQLYLSQSMRQSWLQGFFGQTEDDQLNDDADQDTMKVSEFASAHSVRVYVALTFL